MHICLDRYDVGISVSGGVYSATRNILCCVFVYKCMSLGMQTLTERPHASHKSVSLSSKGTKERGAGNRVVKGCYPLKPLS